MLSHSYAFGRRRLILNTSITSHFPYCLILWMFHSRKLNERTDSIHERAIRVVCKEYESSFQELIIVGNSLNIRHWNLQKVLTETFKFKNCSWPGLVIDLVWSCLVEFVEKIILSTKKFAFQVNGNLYEKYDIKTPFYLGPKLWNPLWQMNIKLSYCLWIIRQKSEAVDQRSSVNKMFLEFRKIHRKTPVPESLF